VLLVGDVFAANQMVTETYSFTIAPDSVAPSAISDLGVSDLTDTTVTLSWTATGDDGAIGTASSYDIRYSTSVIDAGNWASAAQVSGEPVPGAAGSSESMVISGLSAETTYYFAMKVTDDAANESGLSNVISQLTASVPDTTPPYVSGYSPPKGAANIAADTDIVLHVKDDGVGVDISTIVMKVNGQVVSPTITGTPADYTVTYDPITDFEPGQIVTVTVDAADLAN